MRAQHNPAATPVSDEIPPPSVLAQVPCASGKAALLERVDEYEQDGSLRANSDATFLAVILAELIRIACGLEDAAQETLSHLSWSAGSLGAECTIAQYLRVVRRIERYARLETINRRIPRDRVA